VAYSAPNNVVSINGAEIPVNRTTLTIQQETAVVYTEGGLMASLLNEIREIKEAVRRIERHQGIPSSDNSNVPDAGNQLASLGWSEREIDETRFKLSGLAEGWNDPSMDAYDDL
jgi:hypothetical protein